MNSSAERTDGQCGRSIISAAPSTTLNRALLQGIGDLPVLPTVLTSVLQLDPAADDYFDRLVELAEHDPLFAARVIHLANTARYQRRGPAVLSVRTAVSRLGSRAAGEILTAMSVMRVFVPRTPAQRHLWLHALQAAIGSRRLAAATRATTDPGTIYLGALLHDVGRFVMLDVSPEELGQVDEAGFATPEELVAVEKGICGLDHATLGSKTARAWGLPDWICRFIAAHHHHPRRADPDLREALGVLQAADRIGVMLCAPPVEEPDDEQIEIIAQTVAARRHIALSAPRIARHIRPIWDQSHAIMASLGL